MLNIMECRRKMVELYFPINSAIISGFGFDMLYAGPREALLHATFRQNCGCTHLIIGRDHAGVGDYYGAFEAQEIFEQGFSIFLFIFSTKISQDFSIFIEFPFYRKFTVDHLILVICSSRAWEVATEDLRYFFSEELIFHPVIVLFRCVF